MSTWGAGALAVQAPLPGDRGVLCIPGARWLRWDGAVLEVGEGPGATGTLALRAEEVTLVGGALRALTLRPGDGRRLAVAARFPSGATVLVERRGGRIAVAASPEPRPKAAG
jgi:hypothetical protein